MRKILFIAIFMFGATGIGHAAPIDGETTGTSKHTITGFGNNDIFQADSNTGATTVVLTDVANPVSDNTSLNTVGVANGFIHDFIFNTIESTFITISSVSETSTGQINFIDPLIIEIWEIVAGAGNDVLLGTDTLAAAGANSREASVFVLLEASKNYVVRMSNEGSPGTVGASPDYSLEIVSAVPVPAAVWLFGTALLGLFGYKRKAQAAAAA